LYWSRDLADRELDIGTTSWGPAHLAAELAPGDAMLDMNGNTELPCMHAARCRRCVISSCPSSWNRR
jgi:hypothetical protein